MSEVQRRGRRGEQWIVNMGRQFRVTQTRWPGERRVKNDVNEGIGEWGPVGELWPDISWALSHLWREGNSDMLELWGRGAGHRWHLQCRRTPGPRTDTGTVTSLNILTFSPNINSWNISGHMTVTSAPVDRQWGLWVRRHGGGYCVINCLSSTNNASIKYQLSEHWATSVQHETRAGCARQWPAPVFVPGNSGLIFSAAHLNKELGWNQGMARLWYPCAITSGCLHNIISVPIWRSYPGLMRIRQPSQGWGRGS